MSFCPGSHAAGSYRLVPIREPEQPDSSPEDARGIDQGLRARTSLGGSLRLPGLRNSRREVSQSLQRDGIALGVLCPNFVVRCGATLWGAARANCQRRHDEQAIGCDR
jgi:hypothetical protein